jgi:hypothetical protein
MRPSQKAETISLLKEWEHYLSFWHHLPKSKVKPSINYVLLETYVVTFFLQCNKRVFRLPKEIQLIEDFFFDLQILALIGYVWGTNTLACILKDESSKIRNHWLEGSEYLGFLKGVRDYAIFGYLGRSLPQKMTEEVDKDVEVTYNSFFEDSWIQGSGKIMNLTRNILNRWTTRPEAHYTVENTPYSESASLITPRSIGGQSRLYRDLYAVCQRHSLFSNEIRGFDIPLGKEGTPQDRMLSIQTMPTNLYDYRDRGKRTNTIASFLRYLDDPFLDHLKRCNDPDCTNPELHFPFKLQGIPTSGWRTRPASLPWPSILFMTEIPRRCIMRGAKNDKVTSSALSDFKDLPEVCDYDYINSTDLASATDNFPLSVQEHFGSCIAKWWKKTYFEDYITSSFRTNRLVTLPFKTWPGLDFFIKKIRKRRPTIKEMFPQLVRKKGMLDLLAKFGFDQESQSSGPYVTEPDRNEITEFNDGHIFVKSMKNRWAKYERMSGSEYYLTKRGDYDYRNLYELGKDELLILISYIRDWYREAFKSIPGRLTRKGQHQSLPLSWVTLAALNTACAVSSKTTDPNSKILTMGDDCVYGTNNRNGIITYQRNLTQVGCIINRKKDATSTIRRAIFCEHMVANGQWLDKPRPKIVSQPEFDQKEIHWLTVREELPKFMDHRTKKLIRELLIEKHAGSIERSIRTGFSPSLPKEFGGLGVDIPGRFDDFFRMKLSNINPTPERILEIDRRMQEIAAIQPKSNASKFIWSMINDIEYKIGGRDGMTYENGQDILISTFLPILILETTFSRESFKRKTPEEVGQSMYRVFSSMEGQEPTLLTCEQLTKIRRQIRIKSDQLTQLKRNQDASLEFWRTR